MVGYVPITVSISQQYIFYSVFFSCFTSNRWIKLLRSEIHSHLKQQVHLVYVKSNTCWYSRWCWVGGTTLHRSIWCHNVTFSVNQNGCSDFLLIMIRIFNCKSSPVIVNLNTRDLALCIRHNASVRGCSMHNNIIITPEKGGQCHNGFCLL